MRGRMPSGRARSGRACRCASLTPVRPWFTMAPPRDDECPIFLGGTSMYRIGKSIAAALALVAVATAAAAQDFPNKPITVIVPFAAGGPTDTVARLVAQSMTNYLKQQVIVE